jgi:hypothetical protein
LMARCTYIKVGRERCRGVAVRGSDLCAAHHPDYRERRRSGARRGGKARGTSEMASVKAEIKRVIEDVLDSRIERGVGTAAFMGFNALLKAIETERRIREQDELEERIAALEQAEGVRGWGA